MSETKITVTVRKCTIPFNRSQLIASGMDCFHCEWARLRYDNGDLWAWPFITVTAEADGVEGSCSYDYCSFLGENDFRNSQLFEELKGYALAELERAKKALDCIKVSDNMGQELDACERMYYI